MLEKRESSLEFKKVFYCADALYEALRTKGAHQPIFENPFSLTIFYFSLSSTI